MWRNLFSVFNRGKKVKILQGYMTSIYSVLWGKFTINEASLCSIKNMDVESKHAVL